MDRKNKKNGKEEKDRERSYQYKDGTMGPGEVEPELMKTVKETSEKLEKQEDKRSKDNKGPGRPSG